jgi:hypothetical protein
MCNEQLKKLETDLWSVADRLRFNSGLKSSEYTTSALGLIGLTAIVSIETALQAPPHDRR